MQRGRQVRNIQTLPILAIEVDCKRKKSDPRRCARHNGRVRENPGRQQACWGFLIRCTNLTQPTGNLDSKNSQDVIDLLTKASRHYQQTILMITHNNGLTSMVDRVLRVTDGVLTDLGGNANEKLS